MNTKLNISTQFKLFSLFGLCTAVCLVLALPVSAQQKAGKKPNEPSWITMMDDPNVNYFKAVEAFEAFWKGRETPIEENELFATEGKKDKEEELSERKHGKLPKDDPAIIYAFEYKRFKHWQREMAPFVKADGSVKSMDERIAEWKIDRQQRKAHEFMPKKGKKN